MSISQTVAKRIAELLKEKNISQYKLEYNACLSHKTTKSIMKDKAKGVNLKTIIAIADGFNMSVSQFLDSELFEYNNLIMD